MDFFHKKENTAICLVSYSNSTPLPPTRAVTSFQVQLPPTQTPPAQFVSDSNRPAARHLRILAVSLMPSRSHLAAATSIHCNHNPHPISIHAAVAAAVAILVPSTILPPPPPFHCNRDSIPSCRRRRRGWGHLHVRLHLYLHGGWRHHHRCGGRRKQ